jgi:hypothetical protein
MWTSADSHLYGEKMTANPKDGGQIDFALTRQKVRDQMQALQDTTTVTERHSMKGVSVTSITKERLNNTPKRASCYAQYRDF